MFQSKLYNMLSDPSVLKSLRDWLMSGDVKERGKAWELVLKHLIPVGKDGQADGPRSFHVHMGVPRPDQAVTIDVTEKPAGS